MKKAISLFAVTAILCIALFSFAGAKGQGPLVVSDQYAYIEEGFEGDCWDGVVDTVVLSEDGTYVRSQTTSIIHASGRVVTNWTYTAWGTYEVGEDDGETRTVTLSAPTDVEYVYNGELTTIDDDASLLEYFGEEVIQITLLSSKFTKAE